MLDFLKKYKYILIVSVCAIAVLAVAFFAGESITDNETAVMQESTTSDTTGNTVLENEAATDTSLQKDFSDDKSVENKTTENKTTQSTTVSTSEIQKETQQSVQKQTDVKVSSSSQSSRNGSETGSNSSSASQSKPQSSVQQETQENTLKCTVSISCATVLKNMDLLDSSKSEVIPSDGWILKPVTVTFNEGDSAFDVLEKICKENKIHLEYSFTPLYNSTYIEGINNLYEFDCGSLSGWRYAVNSEYVGYGSSSCQLENGDVIEWKYTCDYGEDIGAMNISED